MFQTKKIKTLELFLFARQRNPKPAAGALWIPKLLRPQTHQVRFAVVEPLLEAVAGEQAVARRRTPKSHPN
jgi:hypothetical protein